ncbi:MAG: response regulator [Rhodanobacteraceae bacterium]
MNESADTLVVIVDDDHYVLESLEDLLASGGFRTRAFISGQAFLESGALLSTGCLISDVYMPNMTGWELGARARAGRPQLPIILMSGNDEAFSNVSMHGERAGHVLMRKPLDGPKLLDAVRAALAK